MTKAPELNLEGGITSAEVTEAKTEPAKEQQAPKEKIVQSNCSTL